MPYRFETLEIWKLARAFSGGIYLLTRTFPKEELFALTSQMRRASLSCVLNIAEGSERKSDKEFIRFLRIAKSSIHEVVAAGFICLDQGYVELLTFQKMYDKSHTLTKKINALIRYLEK